MPVSNARSPKAQPGIRRLQASRDLRSVVKLVGDAFAGDMDERALAALREMRWLARMTPLVWWLEQTDPSFGDWFGGFVWEQDGRIVGNASLQPAPGRRRAWVVCNVVVDPAYRGQGIGRRLVEAAMEEAQVRGAEAILLQVRDDNVEALSLYERLGFRPFGGEAVWHLPEARPVAWRPAPGVRFSRWDAKTGPLAMALAREALPAAQQWLRPVRPKDYAYGWVERTAGWLAGLLSGRRTLRLAAWQADADGGRRLAAIMVLRLNRHQGEHLAEVLIHPDASGQGLEEMLVGHLLEVVSDLPQCRLAVSYPAGQHGLRDLLARWGFLERRTLLTMQYVPLSR